MEQPSVSVAEIGNSNSEISSDISSSITEERSFDIDEKISLYNNQNKIIDETKSITSQFSDPESILSKPKPSEKNSALETDQENKIEIEEKKEAKAKKEEEKEIKRIQTEQKIQDVKSELNSIYKSAGIIESVASVNQTEAVSEKVNTEKVQDFKIDTLEKEKDNLEKNNFEKYAGAVVYHLESTKDISSMKIALIKTGDSWALPENMIDPKKDEKTETKKVVQDQMGLSTDVNEKIESVTKTMSTENSGTLTMEGNYFTAESQSTVISSTPEGNEVKWFTVADLQKDFSIVISRNDMALINKAIVSIAEKQGLF